MRKNNSIELDILGSVKSVKYLIYFADGNLSNSEEIFVSPFDMSLIYMFHSNGKVYEFINYDEEEATTTDEDF